MNMLKTTLEQVVNRKTIDKHRRKPSVSAVQRTVSLNAISRKSAINSALKPQTVVNGVNYLASAGKHFMGLGEVG